MQGSQVTNNSTEWPVLSIDPNPLLALHTEMMNMYRAASMLHFKKEYYRFIAGFSIGLLIMGTTLWMTTLHY